MKQTIKGLILGLILGTAMTAFAAQFTINIPNAIVTRVVNAWSIGRGWTSKSPLTKQQYAKKQIRNTIRDQVINYEATGAQRQQWDTTGTDTEGIDIP